MVVTILYILIFLTAINGILFMGRYYQHQQYWRSLRAAKETQNALKGGVLARARAKRGRR